MITTLLLQSGAKVYTKLLPEEVRMYMQGGSRGGVIEAYFESTFVTKVYVNVSTIQIVSSSDNYDLMTSL